MYPITDSSPRPQLIKPESTSLSNMASGGDGSSRNGLKLKKKEELDLPARRVL